MPTPSTENAVWGRIRPLVFRTIIGAVIAAGIVGVVAVLVGDFGTVALQLLLTIVVVIVFALLSWYDADVSSRRSGTFALVSVATSLYLLIAGFLKVWVVRHDPYGTDDGWVVGEQFWQWIGLVLVARAALLHVHLLLNIHRRYPTPVLQVVAKSTVGVIAVLALLVSLPIMAAHTHFADGYWRVLWVVVILDLLGTVIVPLTSALFRPRHPGLEARHVPAPDGRYGAWPGPASVPVPIDGAGAGGWAEAPLANGTAQAGSAQAGSAQADAAQSSANGAAGAQPAGLVYEPAPAAERTLAWPRYVDGTPLPAQADGTPDFSGAARR